MTKMVQLPRLPFDHVFHHNKYRADKETQYAQMADYDQTISEYYDQRTNGNRKRNMVAAN